MACNKNLFSITDKMKAIMMQKEPDAFFTQERETRFAIWLEFPSVRRLDFLLFMTSVTLTVYCDSHLKTHSNDSLETSFSIYTLWCELYSVCLSINVLFRQLPVVPKEGNRQSMSIIIVPSKLFLSCRSFCHFFPHHSMQMFFLEKVLAQSMRTEIKMPTS